jgi:hypothetical protein
MGTTNTVTLPALNQSKVITDSGREAGPSKKVISRRPVKKAPAVKKKSLDKKKDPSPKGLARRISSAAKQADQLSFRVRDFKAGNFQGHHNNKRGSTNNDRALNLLRSKVPEWFGTRFTHFPQDAVAIRFQDLKAIEQRLSAISSAAAKLTEKLPKMGEAQLQDRKAELPKERVDVSSFSELYRLESDRSDGKYSISLNANERVIILTPTQEPPGPAKSQSPANGETSIFNKMVLRGTGAPNETRPITTPAFVIKLPDSADLDEIENKLTYSPETIIPSLIIDIQDRAQAQNTVLDQLNDAFAQRSQELVDKRAAQEQARIKAEKSQQRSARKVAKRKKTEDPSINTVVNKNSGKAFSDGSFTKALASFFSDQMKKGKEQIQQVLNSVQKYRQFLEAKTKPVKRSHEQAFKIAGLTALEDRLHSASLPEQVVYARKKSDGPGSVSVRSIDERIDKNLAALAA